MAVIGQNNAEFVFPADRFPPFSSSPQNNGPNGAKEEFGPPLSCEPLSRVYTKRGLLMSETGYEFIPEGEECSNNVLELLYNAVDDTYFRPKIGTKVTTKLDDWNNGVWRYVNIQRVVEDDWQMAYLTRENVFVTPKGNILDGFLEYRFNLKAAGKKVKRMNLRLPCTDFRDGKVRVLVCSRDDYTVLMDTQETTEVFRAQGWEEFIIRVELSGKEQLEHYVTTYQNAQIFRQPLNRALRKQAKRHYEQSTWNNPFQVVIEMEDADDSVKRSKP